MVLVEDTTKFSRQPDLDAYLNSLDPAVMQHINDRWEGKLGRGEGKAWMPFDHGHSQTVSGIDFAFQCLKWAMNNGFVDESQAHIFRNAVMQWLHEKQGMNMGYGKKYMPAAARRRR